MEVRVSAGRESRRSEAQPQQHPACRDQDSTFSHLILVRWVFLYAIVKGGKMIYLGEAVIDGSLFSVFSTEDGRIIYLP